MCLNTIQDSLKAIELNFLTQVEISLTSDQLTRLGQENEYCCSLAKFAGQIGSQQSAVSATKVFRLQISLQPRISPGKSKAVSIWVQRTNPSQICKSTPGRHGELWNLFAELNWQEEGKENDQSVGLNKGLRTQGPQQKWLIQYPNKR